ncbi:MAG: 1-acyl-sn-glycerol-3-phosphate acyltransferase [Dokdonella sp.]|uniref:lysophospholipid acyltransferase family protein n=1 Tax=Dokdonella sp. TaxID=2291710 RepID=UPI0025BC0761|nr:lysophospholipid acyltransferase family protein [Dokdonella sp.]MBZ0222334.1 1-acyl-sn-glycerol-3-phosphate acyltransferase [Dokdonella sp.]MCC7256182.1 1-acyl-sn-glycerol-3-phosphate acyltransferase [Dokdonella sp.]
MHSPAQTLATPAPADRLRPLRYVWRVPLLFFHGMVAVPLTLCAFNPLAKRMRIGSTTVEKFLVRWWSGRLIRIFGMRIRAFGEPLPDAVLFVANHISWLDIELMHSQRAMSFVAKSEIERWPFIGWLAASAGTIFHRRGSSDSLAAVMGVVVERLQEGRPVGVFPEGGSGHGERVGTFHARIFQTALDAQVPVQPVALRYGRDGTQDPSVPFARKEKFFPNLVRLLGNPRMDAEVHFLEPVALAPEARRRMAEESRARITAALGYGDD